MRLPFSLETINTTNLPTLSLIISIQNGTKLRYYYNITTFNFQPSDTKDYNSDTLSYAPVRIVNKTECMEAYKDIPTLLNTINKYMICTNKGGNIDDNGNIIVPPIPVVDGCKIVNTTLRSKDVSKNFCNEYMRYMKIDTYIDNDVLDYDCFYT